MDDVASGVSQARSLRSPRKPTAAIADLRSKDSLIAAKRRPEERSDEGYAEARKTGLVFTAARRRASGSAPTAPKVAQTCSRATLAVSEQTGSSLKIG
jgi:hypothetical protein